MWELAHLKQKTRYFSTILHDHPLKIWSMLLVMTSELFVCLHSYLLLKHKIVCLYAHYFSQI